ncbi:MAG: glycoside hydrolase family 127 protein [Lachnospiraceae bacterium]|nr:glycoside hydrolase family 127 protein [Lachnospiraceae bacterium]
MDRKNFSMPADLKKLDVSDGFWKKEMELVRTEVIPYQWEALNDRVKDAAPSFSMHNFRAAGLLKKRSHEDPDFKAPVFGNPGFEVLPDDPDNVPEDKFFGFLFQDSDFYKWVEAVAYSLMQHPDEELMKRCDEAIDIVRDAQADDGYLDTYYILNGRDREFTNLRDNHELYCFGHLAEAAAAYFKATGHGTLLEVAKRYADYISEKIGPEEGKKRGYPGHEVAELALVRLYEITNDPKCLALARYFIDERGQEPSYFAMEAKRNGSRDDHGQLLNSRNAYYQAHKPVRLQDEAVGHAVRAMYLYSGMADIARVTEDESLAEACEKLWYSTTHEKMYITGGVGATHIGEAFSFPFDLPNDTVYAESCASIGLVFFARRMLQMAPKAEYADVMEKCLYNGIISGMALDGKSFFYVNPLEVLPRACHFDERKAHVKPVRQKWFGCACCPPNIARMLGSVGSYAFTENEDTLFAHLYMSSRYVKDVNGREVVITEEKTEEDGRWTVKFSAENAPEEFALMLRIPGWSCETSVNGRDVSEFDVKDGYIRVSGEDLENGPVTLTFTFKPVFMAADPRVREDQGKTALMYGPWVYALEEADNGKDLHLLRVCPDKAAEIRSEVREIAGVPARVLLVPGVRDVRPESSALYVPLHGTSAEEAVTLTYIPYYMWANRGENEMQVWTRF